MKRNQTFLSFFLFSLSLTFVPVLGSATTFTFNGTSGNDYIVVEQALLTGTFTIRINGVLIPHAATNCSAGYNVVVNGLGGADDIEMDFQNMCGVHCKIDGGSGSDDLVMFGCDEGEILGGLGEDYIFIVPESGSGTITGGDHDDWIEIGGGSHVYASGGTGDDHLEARLLDSGEIRGDEGNDFFSSVANGTVVFVGGPGADYFWGGFHTIFCDYNDLFDEDSFEYENAFGCIP